MLRRVCYDRRIDTGKLKNMTNFEIQIETLAKCDYPLMRAYMYTSTARLHKKRIRQDRYSRANTGELRRWVSG